MKKIALLTAFLGVLSTSAQEKVMTKELLWDLGRLGSVQTMGDQLYYSVSYSNVLENSWSKMFYKTDVKTGVTKEIEVLPQELPSKLLSPDNEFLLSVKNVKLTSVLGKDLYPNLLKSNAYIYNSLDYRHWDTWNKGDYQHVFVKNIKTQDEVDILENEPYYCPQKPFGGIEDFVWHPNSKEVIYVCKKKQGTEYALSTNTDLYSYNINTKQTTNLTSSNLGYDTQPSFSPAGNLTWLQMKRDGYEADKNDIIVRKNNVDYNLTANWDGTVSSYKWSEDGKRIYFIAVVKGTKQVFEFFGRFDYPIITQLTKGEFDVNSIVSVSADQLIITRSDFNTANEVYSFGLESKKWKQLSEINNVKYRDVAKSKIEQRYVETTDGKQMLVYVIYPPNFDKNKKYPTLLYCQGGPQSAVSQFYSFRWNFQLMAAQGYIIVAPNRRGMPGFGVKWNEDISKDWGGQAMKDYLTAIDEVAKEPFVDNDRLGAVGASYGGYSVYFLAGNHQKRFKTFISHCGVFNLESMYGTTEEVFFTNWDAGGSYWDKGNIDAVKTYAAFNPKNYVNNWDTPMLVIHGGNDYRVPIGQGQEAFQVAQLKGIKSRFLYFPTENHWVLNAQNAQIWQAEFFKWLKETL